MKIRYMTIFLILLVCLVGAVSAADDVADDTLDEVADDAVAIDDVQEEVSEDVSTEPADTAADDTLQAQDNNDELKTGTKTVEVNNFAELTDAINGAVNDAENDTYIINLNPGDASAYKTVTTTFDKGANTPNIIINGNNQVLSGTTAKKLYFKNGCNITINNCTISSKLFIYDNLLANNCIFTTRETTNYGNLTVMGSTINYYVYNYANARLIIGNSTLNSIIMGESNTTIVFEDDVIFGESCSISSQGNIIINDTSKIVPYLEIYNGDYILKDTIINSAKTNYGNLTIRNSTINNRIINYGKLIIGDDVLFGDNCIIDIRDNGEVITNNTKALFYIEKYYNENTLENGTITKAKFNYGQLTIINSIVNAYITNYGKIIFRNSTILSTISLYPGCTVVFEDDVKFEGNFVLQVQSGSTIIINDTRKITPYMNNYYGENIIENVTLKTGKCNYGNLTIRNSTVPGIENNGNMIIENSTLGGVKNNGVLTIRDVTIMDSSSIQNSGTLIIGDNVTFGTRVSISGSGKIITDDMTSIFRYMGKFYGEATIELNYNKQVLNYGNLTIENSTINYNASTYNYMESYQGATLSFKNCTLNTPIYNEGTLIISDDTIIGESFKLTGKGALIINDTHPSYQDLLDFVTVYSGNIVLNNKTINTAKTNKGTLTLNNCTIDSTINNMGRIIIDEDTVFGPNAKITGDSEIVIGDITKILPIIDAINGNYVIENVNLTKSYIFDGMITLNNCTINASDNINYGTLYLRNCTINVGEDNTFLTNYGTVTISKDTKITGKIDDLVDGVIYEGAPKTYVVNDRTLNIYFDSEGYLTSRVNPGDTLDIRGTIRARHSLIINKPVNIISSTGDAYIDLNTTGGSYFGENPGACFSITKDGAYTNVTGIYFHNTQLWIYETHHVTLDGISAVVEDQRVGSGVGQTSIRQNSSYITVKNSYFYTKDNEGSSTLVLAWANYCTIENNTIVGVGNVGNLLYLTTYNVNIPQGSVINSYNKLINNKLTGPEIPLGICFGITLSGYGNLVDNNTLTYSGQGIMFQWGSGVTGVEQEGSLIGSGDNVVCNNKLYGGCSIEAGDIVYNNYVEGKLSVHGKVFNNTANELILVGSAEVTNNTILGPVSFSENSGISNAVLSNNTIAGNIKIASTATNNTISDNDITGTVTLDGSYNKLSNNKITTTEDYAVYSNKLGVNNTLTDNYMVANGKVGADAVSLRDPSNTIQDSTLATTIAVTAPSEATVNKTVKVTIKLMDKNGNPITAQVTVTTSVGSETVNITNGQAVYEYTPTAIGQDTVTVKYLGNASLYPSTNTAKINVAAESEKQNQSGGKTPSKESSKKPVIKLSAKNKANVDYAYTYKVRVTSNGKSIGAGKQVTLKIGKTTLKAKTNKNGYATFTLAVKPATYTVTAIYGKVSQKYKVTVKNVVQAKNLKVKKSAKKIKVKVTLKTSAKKPIAGKKVTIKINNKKVTAKTNKKGVATLNIKKIVKKLKAGKKYKYQAIYGKDIVTKKLTVKK